MYTSCIADDVPDPTAPHSGVSDSEADGSSSLHVPDPSDISDSEVDGSPSLHAPSSHFDDKSSMYLNDRPQNPNT